MGLNLSDLEPVYIVCGKTDLRKGIDSLAYLIQSQFALDPL
ncbi:IS66 family insertion sequence element accessory protein TnpB [Enterococcus cecorum]